MNLTYALSPSSSVAASMQIRVYDVALGDDRRISLSQIADFIRENYSDPAQYTQTVAPVTGFSITVAGDTATADVWLMLLPAGTLAAGTVILPLASTCADGQEVLITSSQIITALTVSLNGASAGYGLPTAATANGFYRLRFSKLQNAWFRVG